MIDPFGNNANLYYTEYWTVYEQNENKLPWEKWVILNRVVWSAVSAITFYSIYAKFDFHQQPIHIKWPWKKEKITQRTKDHIFWEDFVVKNNIKKKFQVKVELIQVT